MTSSRLLEPHELAELGPPEAVRLPLDLVDANPNNPRKQLLEINELAQNIRTFSLLQPIAVRRVGDRYEVLGGHRRLAAFHVLREAEPLEPQWKTIPSVIRTADDERAHLMLISSQVHTQAWRPREEAAIIEELATTRTLTVVGELLHKSLPWVSKRLKTYADSVLSGYAQTGRLAVAVAEELLPIKDPEVRRQLAERAVAEHWTQDQARRGVRALRIDAQLRELGRRAAEMVDLLSSVDPSKIPIEAARDLWTLYGLIERISGRTQPRFPTVEAAEKVAGVTAKTKARAAAKRKRRRAMPPPR